MSVHSEAWNECSLECTSLILVGLKDPSDSVIGQLHCNNSAVGTTEIKISVKRNKNKGLLENFLPEFCQTFARLLNIS